MKHDKGIKRYNLTLPIDLFNKNKEIAEENYTSIAEVMKSFIKLGIKLYDAQKKTMMKSSLGKKMVEKKK